MNFWRFSGATIEERSQSTPADGTESDRLPYHRRLQRLAFFLTGDHSMAEGCLVDATLLLASHHKVEFKEWLAQWGRRATIRSAIAQQRPDILRLSKFYQKVSCPHKEHPAPSLRQIVRVQNMAEYAVLRLDLLCRLTLVLRGLERYSSAEAGRMLGISPEAVESAYCAALEETGIMIRESEGEPEPAAPCAGNDVRWRCPPRPTISERVGRHSPLAFVKGLFHRAPHGSPNFKNHGKSLVKRREQPRTVGTADRPRFTLVPSRTWNGNGRGNSL